MDPVRIGIIGIGQIGKHHLGNYEKIPGAKVVAGSTNPDKVEGIRKELGAGHDAVQIDVASE